MARFERNTARIGLPAVFMGGEIDYFKATKWALNCSGP